MKVKTSQTVSDDCNILQHLTKGNLIALTVAMPNQGTNDLVLSLHFCQQVELVATIPLLFFLGKSHTIALIALLFIS